MYTPHVPHGWDCGVLFDVSTKTLLCGDLFTQAGADMPAVTESEILMASEGMRGMMDYYAHATSTTAILERLAELGLAMLACQHGSTPIEGMARRCCGSWRRWLGTDSATQGVPHSCHLWRKVAA